MSANVPLLNAANVFTNSGNIFNSSTVAFKASNAAGANAISYLSFQDSAASERGYVGLANGASSIVALRASTAGAELRLSTNGGNITLDGVSATDFARLSVASNDFNSAVAGGKQIAITNTNSGTTSYAFQTLVNDVGRSLQFIRTSSGWSGTWLTGGPSGEQSGLNSSGAFPLTIGVNGTERIRITSAGVITFNGVDAADFARLSQSNTFTLANKFSGASIGSILLEDLSSPADEKLWRIFSSGSQFGVQSRTDANGAGANIITASRIGTTVTTLALAATALTLNGRDFGTSTLPALSGVNLTSLNASNLGSGTVPDARFPATLPALNGSALTTLSASNISSGALADARLSANIPLLNAANTFTNGTQKISITSGNAQFEVKTTDAAGQPELKITNSTNSWSAYMPAGTSNLRFHDGGNDRLSIANGGNFDFKGGTVTTNNASASEVGYKGLPQNSQSVSYTTVLADCNKNLHQTGATKTFTIDSNANVAAPIGTVLNFTCDNATGVSIAITTDTLRLAGTATTGTRTLAQYGVASAIKILSTTWLISGQGLS